MSALPAKAANAQPRGIPPDRKLRHSGRLHRHADYQRVYRMGTRRSLPLMTYFVAAQTVSAEPQTGPRIGITAGRVLGNAVERNRIKRRMREAIRRHRQELTASVDLIFHPRRAVLEAEFDAIERDLVRALHWAQGAFPS